MRRASLRVAGPRRRVAGPRRRVAALLAATVAGLATAAAAPAYAAQGSIDHVENKRGTLEVLYSVPGSGTQTPDLSSLRVTVDGHSLKATGQPASQAAVRRTTILAIDVSNSMAGPKFTAAKRAATLFLRSAPADVRVGIVTFAGKVHVAQKPSLDRRASLATVTGLTLSQGTHLYDGLVKAVHVSGATGSRNVLVLSDGRDTSTATMAQATKAIKASGVRLDVIALAQSAKDEALLAPLSRAGGGDVISAADPQQLATIFTAQAQTLASQILISAPLPAGSPAEGSLSVHVDIAGSTYDDVAYVTLGTATKAAAAVKPKAAATALTSAPQPRQISPRLMEGGVAALGVGLLVLVLAIFGGAGRKKQTLESRIEAYTIRGGGIRKAAPAQAPTMAAQAVGVAAKALSSSRGFEARLGSKLDAGGLSLKPAEWLLLHAGIALGVTALVFVLTGASLLLTMVGLLAGILIPWLYLGRKQSKRLKAFNGQLAPTLQLLAGSLQAGLSIAQGMDTIVREGAEPVAGEFRRALVETRLGVSIENALDSMATRMMSEDFRWTVMAIRIQREVGGNLAELMLNVAATLRERDYLRRQVKSLSAEGRFSAYILLGLPPGILLFEATTHKDYLHPLYTTPIGFFMLGAMVFLMGLGSFTMQRMIKLEV